MSTAFYSEILNHRFSDLPFFKTKKIEVYILRTLYYIFSSDMKEESIHLVSAENVSLEKLPSKVPKDSGRYHLYRFNHTHEGDYMESIGE